MKKIDLHVHTEQTLSDYAFNFSMDTLKNYVSKRRIDCIAITNHNIFDLEQFSEITKELDIVVYPGIEIDLEKGHILVIADPENIVEFNDKCKEVECNIKKSDDYLTIDQFTRIFNNLDDYLLIPHYKKSPAIKPQYLEILKPYVKCGEVQSEKKFYQCLKDPEALVPVLFSDERMSDEKTDFLLRQMFIDSDELKLSDLKICLSDKNKVSLNENEGNDLFQILDNGFCASTGLNVILGERSSGKTVTLNKIDSLFENVKYIRQFSLVEKDEEKEKRVFKEKISTQRQKLFESYLDEFKYVVDDINKINKKENDKQLDDYISSLIKYAEDYEKRDSFSRAKIYTETSFEIKELESLKKLIDSTKLLIENKEYRSIIDSFVSLDSLSSLLLALVNKYKEIKLENQKKEIVNTIIKSTKDLLSLKTRVGAPKDCSFKDIIIDEKKISRFSNIVKSIKESKVIASEDLYGFKVIASTEILENATAVGTQYGKKASFADAYNSYGNPYEYILKLKEMKVIPETEFYKLFIKMTYRILNQYDAEVSGGERSEFNLLAELSDAKTYDMLLIDEPESSFDNLFLKSSVNNLIKDLSNEMPVFIVTHNNTVGESIKPDYIIYTKRIVNGSDPIYKIYGGYPSSKLLKSVDGECIENYMVLMDCLEGGEDTYQERNQTYEILRNTK